MLGIHDLWFFIVSGLLLNIRPGLTPPLLWDAARSLGGVAGRSR
jgi:hypothetical protein